MAAKSLHLSKLLPSGSIKQAEEMHMAKTPIPFIFFIGILVATFPVAPAMAQNSDGLSTVFQWNDDVPEAGTLYHYIISTNNKFGDDGKVTDYWAYRVDNQRWETLYDDTNLGTSKDLWHDIWIQKSEYWQFSRHLHRNLAVPAGKNSISQDSSYDFDAKALRTQFVYDNGRKATRLSDHEDILWEPTVWHRDLGFWFVAFFPYLKGDIKHFTIMVNSWKHLIPMTVIASGKEVIDGIPCVKYDLKGQGLLSTALHRGAVWVSDDDARRVVRWQQTIALSWTLPQLQARLVEMKPLSASEWEDMKSGISSNK